MTGRVKSVLAGIAQTCRVEPGHRFCPLCWVATAAGYTVARLDRVKADRRTEQAARGDVARVHALAAVQGDDFALWSDEMAQR